MEGGRDDSVVRKLIAFGAAALVASVALRAVATELDLSPLVTLVVAWVLLTALFVGFVLVRARREGASPRVGVQELRERDESRD